LTVTAPRYLNIPLSGPLRLLLKRMQHVYCVYEIRDVHDSPFTEQMNSNLPYPWPDSLHRFPIAGFVAALDGIQVKAGLTPGFSWKFLRSSRDEPTNFRGFMAKIYKFLDKRKEVCC
jgi:hypothetical protein